eukprot:2193669-Prorocentrum_lima.AAC.1
MDSSLCPIGGVEHGCPRAIWLPILPSRGKTGQSILDVSSLLLAQHVTTMVDLVLPEWRSSKSSRQP